MFTQGRWMPFPVEDGAGGGVRALHSAAGPGNRALVLLDGSGREVAFDLAFPVLHGRNGEDGTVQGALELAGVPPGRCGTLSSALCMDKDRAHKLAALAGVRVPRAVSSRRTVPLRSSGRQPKHWAGRCLSSRCGRVLPSA